MLDGRWRASVERGLEPVGRGLGRAGITADGLTIIGLVFAVGDRVRDRRPVTCCSAMFGVILTGLPDILDGSVARTSGRATPRGAFFDSVCDRVADAAHLLRRRVVPRRREPAPAGARARGARDVDAHHLRARPRRVARVRRPGWAHGARRADGAPRDRARVRHPRPDPLDHAGAHRVHRGAALREGLASGNTGTAAPRPSPALPIRTRRGAGRHARAVVGRTASAAGVARDRSGSSPRP